MDNNSIIAAVIGAVVGVVLDECLRLYRERTRATSDGDNATLDAVAQHVQKVQTSISKIRMNQRILLAITIATLIVTLLIQWS